MKANTLKKTIFEIMLWAMVLLLASCSGKEHGSGPNDVPDDADQESEVLFSLRTPDNTRQSTRALGEADENAVLQVDVLVFNQSGKLVKQSVAEKLSTSTGTSEYSQDFTVVLPTGTYDLVFLANSSALISEIYRDKGGSIPEGESRSSIESALKAGAECWNADPTSDDYVLIPMFGQIADAEVTGSAKLNGGEPVGMVRMLSRIDIRVGYGAQGYFKLKDVRLYNRNTEGYLIPNTSTGHWEADKALEATVSGLSLTKGPLVYDSDNSSLSSTGCIQEIYTFEAPKGSLDKAKQDQNTCLVLGAYYGVGNDSEVSYYRVDFVADQPDGTTKCLELLRNHLYDLSITKVSGSGYSTPDAAFKAGPENITIDILVQDEGNMTETVTDGHYQLSVDKSRLLFGLDENVLPMYVYTDYPDGWVVSRGEDWIEVTPGTGNRVEIGVSSTDTDRTGTFTITAGLMSKEITVVQNELGMNISLEVTPEYLTFYKSGKPRTLTINTYPSDLKRYMMGAGGVDWVDGQGPDHLSGRITDTFTFTPKPNTGVTSRNGFITVWVDDKGQVVSKVVKVYQLPYDLLVDYEVFNPYPSAGGDDFVIRFDADAKLKPSVDDSGLFTVVDPEEYKGPGEGLEYVFGLTQNPLYVTRTGRIGFTLGNDLETQYVDITQSGTPVYLNVASPTLAFGSTTAAQSIELSTNATKWKYTTSGNYSQVIKSASLTAGTSYGTSVADATDEATPILTLTPHNGSSTPSANWAKAGDTVTGTVALSSAVGVSGVTEATQTVTVSRTMPAYWIFSSWSNTSTNISASATTVRATVGTNAKWEVSGTYGTTVTQSAMVYGARFLDFTIPANTGWDARTVILTAKAYQADGTTEFKKTTQTYTQGHIPTFTAPSSISFVGGTVNVGVTWGSTPAADINMRLGTTTTGGAVSNVVSGTGSRTLYVTSEVTSQRALYLQYQKGTTGSWYNTGRTVTQLAKPGSSDVVANCGYGGSAKALTLTKDGVSRGWNNGTGLENTYLVHAYGGKCWMVQDSRLGTAATTRYGETSASVASNPLPGNKNGHHYYLYSNASTACPTGWRIPNNEEGYKEVDNLRDELVVDYSHAKSQWWAGSAATAAGAGGGSTGNTNGAWSGFATNSGGNWNLWGSYGEWWYGSTGQNFYGGSSELYVGTSKNTSLWHSVRCVRVN